MKHDTFEKYAQSDLELPQRALLTAWECLTSYRDDLVLVGGLAVKALTHAPEGGMPGPVTLDVDFGISMGTSGGMYGSIRQTLKGHGFDWDAEKKRFIRMFEALDLYIDLLTDDGTADTGTVTVDDSLSVGIVPGIDRALVINRAIPIPGYTLVGSPETPRICVAEVGPMLVLKLNAFGGPVTGRKVPKDAHDILYLAMNYLDGTDRAITAFHEERTAGNRAIPHAVHALENYFSTPDSLGPMSCAAFRMNNHHQDPDLEEESMQIRQQCVSLAQALLG
jgi:hypothetical protein